MFRARLLLRTAIFCPIAITCICSLALADVTITRADPVIQHRSFDPKDPPADMPRLHPNEAAVTESFFGVESHVGGQVLEQKDLGDGTCRASIKVDTVQMTLRLRVTIWLPQNALPKTIHHEEGHREITEHYYQDAYRIAHRQAESLIGQTVSGTGPDNDAAGDAALKQAARELGWRYLGQTDAPSGKAQEVYDQITAHGTNPVKESAAIQQAIRKVGDQPATR